MCMMKEISSTPVKYVRQILHYAVQSICSGRDQSSCQLRVHCWAALKYQLGEISVK